MVKHGELWLSQGCGNILILNERGNYMPNDLHDKIKQISNNSGFLWESWAKESDFDSYGNYIGSIDYIPDGRDKETYRRDSHLVKIVNPNIFTKANILGQNNCQHEWKRVELFTSSITICKHCQVEKSNV